MHKLDKHVNAIVRTSQLEVLMEVWNASSDTEFGTIDIDRLAEKVVDKIKQLSKEKNA